MAQTGEPYFTEDYQSDERFVHRGYIDEAVAGEKIRAILGVPLVVDGRVIGALLAVHRVGAAVPAGRGDAADVVRRARRRWRWRTPGSSPTSTRPTAR